MPSEALSTNVLKTLGSETDVRETLECGVVHVGRCITEVLTVSYHHFFEPLPWNDNIAESFLTYSVAVFVRIEVFMNLGIHVAE